MVVPLPPVVCRKAHVLFTLLVFIYLQWCPTHILLCFYFVFVLVYRMLPVSLDCPFLIAPWEFSNVYLQELQSYPFPNKTPSIWILYILINFLRYCFLIFLTFSLCSMPIDIIRVMVFHATFNNISVLSWQRKPQYSEITTNLSLPNFTTDCHK